MGTGIAGMRWGLGTNTADMVGDGHKLLSPCIFPLSTRQSPIVSTCYAYLEIGARFIKVQLGRVSSHPPIPVSPSINQSVTLFAP